ncbi:MAG: NADP-dependent succinic semialdehyde dehydrogenase [Microbacterium sp. SCN 70-200]|uniref:NADP-dependent succinic semialdehyde dehydrogenase n=1 Tax=unclassified Microbacterium TaxID=2609290 RepID=UPI00086A840A|nr:MULTISPECIES: NADP-dependent succinic semialdehyde dehydrogenase [unclassified Microbacterium]MBN9215038.1 NADP-dependent succinic semialdehyde dehydrogenase [Microbacterium sp.]ODT42875.1 MAG: NADP-dependent succinic semialdehyde dehydrogenase [Microbacterium sp. SCN 70-200]OJV84818.1 MAG: NADP-dependent succinic semialdehyde dehydrogenase [Microbacterium sp. 70-16]
MAIATINPFTGQTEQEFEAHSEAEVDRRIAAAQSAFEALRQTTFAQRAEWMRRAAELLEADADELGRLITIEMGRPIKAARAEVLKSAKGLRFYADHAEEFLAPEALADPSAVGASRAGTRYAPIGIVLAVMPWNYPLWQVLRFAGPALMAGNTGLLKHASNVPQAAIYLDTLFSRAGFPEGAFHSLLIPASRVEAVLRDPRVKATTLTGSEPAGRSLASIAGSEVKHVVLELGGSDPFVVMPSADVDRAASVAVTARNQNNGQSCIAAKRFIVHADVYDEFTRLFSERVAALQVGDPLDESTDVGPIATESGRDELEGQVADAVAKGATVLTGGFSPDRDGWFYQPTVLTGITPEMRLHLEEAFGPVATVYRVDSREEALAIANGTTFGLSSAVWTTDAEEEEWFTENLDAGAVFINGMTASYPELPFGGVKDSGVGRELAAAGIREFCNLKTVWRA